jgi:hypothetical protein
MVRLAEKFMETQCCDRKHVKPVIVLTYDTACISEKRLNCWPCKFLRRLTRKNGL